MSSHDHGLAPGLPRSRTPPGRPDPVGIAVQHQRGYVNARQHRAVAFAGCYPVLQAPRKRSLSPRLGHKPPGHHSHALSSHIRSCRDEVRRKTASFIAGQRSRRLARCRVMCCSRRALPHRRADGRWGTRRRRRPWRANPIAANDDHLYRPLAWATFSTRQQCTTRITCTSLPHPGTASSSRRTGLPSLVLAHLARLRRSWPGGCALTTCDLRGKSGWFASYDLRIRRMPAGFGHRATVAKGALEPGFWGPEWNI